MMNKYSEDTPVVLLVEDELLVRMAAAGDLEDAGFHVLEAANADVALAVLETCSDDVQVLFTDIDMPGSMDGLALARGVAARWPDIGLVVTSGRRLPRPDEMPQETRFLSKPFSEERLVDVVDDA